MAAETGRRVARMLSSDARSAVQPRLLIRRQALAALAGMWPAVAVVTILSAGAVALVIALGRGSFRWVVVGMIVASVAWATVLATVMMSGVALRAMGVAAEQWTSAGLRKLRRRGWQLINGMCIDRRDVDHVLVGPGGVLVVETKWSAETWPQQFDSSDTYPARALRFAIEQSSRNRARISEILGSSVPGNDVRGVVVLWSGAGTSPALEPYSKGNVTVVPGRALAGWLTRATGSPSTIDVPSAMRRLVEHQQSQDREGQRLAGQPTLMQSSQRYIVEPTLAIFAVAALLLGGAATHRLSLLVAELVLSPLVGLALTTWRRARPAGIAWMCSAAAAAVAVALFVAVSGLQ